jgi:glutathione S-transferase
MLTLFGNLDSGNVHKVQMILARRGTAFCRVDVSQTRGEPRKPQFLAVNPMGKVPAVMFEDGSTLSDSGALLFYFAQGSALWPEDTRAQAQALRWMFFEQYNHEPSLAVMRYLRRFAGGEAENAQRLAELEPKARFALSVMEDRLKDHDWIADDGITIADYALYPYSRMAGDSGLDIAVWHP